ncbi:MAG: carbonic anhydrase, partial [Magnetococcales bacterium]|nr:carbonic anhydrase [Magnetococcales bacterium]
IFVHRNIANIVAHADLNCLSVIQYAVEILEVNHIVVCGHFGCGGIITALGERQHGLIDNWLCHVKDVMRFHADLLDGKTLLEQQDLLCELNVREQVKNVCNSSVVQEAWRRGHDLSIHGWIYSIEDGILRDLKVGYSTPHKAINS